MIINENFGLNWKGKSEAIKEISKKTKSKFQVITDKKYINENSKNIFIEGDNLDALKLMQKEYRQKIKMIYIDPPYNTGNNFIYSDDFSNKKKLTNKEYKNTDIEELINQNNINSASFHSDWLSMMLPRLYLSKNLLKPDGIIFISIDHRENATLRLLMNSIYGEENFIGEFIWHNRTTPNYSKKNFAIDHEYILAYSKNAELCNFKGVNKDFSKYKNPDKDKNGAWIADNPSAASGSESYKFPIENPFTNEIYYPPKGRFWAFAPKRIKEWTKSGKLVFPKTSGKRFLLKKYLKELKSYKKPTSSIIKNILTLHGTKELKEIFDAGSPFKYAKPTSLIQFLIEQCTENQDIVMDFFAGSGTTAHAVLKSNIESGIKKSFIIVQIPKQITENSTIFKSGYKKITDITEKRINSVIDSYLNSFDNKNNAFDLNYKYYKII